MLIQLGRAYFCEEICQFIWRGTLFAAALCYLACMAACAQADGSTVTSEPSYPTVIRAISAQGLRDAGYDGQDVRIGVISDGIANYSNLKRAGILPPGLVAFGGEKSTGDEGNSLLQIIHQIVPRAKLAFCDYRLGLATCAMRLMGEFHADVVVSDFARITTSFKYSKTAQALARLRRNYPNVLLFNGDGNFAGNYYRAKWKPVPWRLNGVEVLAQDFGASTGQPSLPYNVIRIWKDSFQLQILGHVHVIGASAPCTSLPLRVVLLNRRDRVIASSPLGTYEGSCNSLQLVVSANKQPINVDARKYPALGEETIYHVALVGPLLLKKAKFRIRLRGFAAVHSKPHRTPSGIHAFSMQFFKWRYASSGSAGTLAGAFGRTGFISIAPLNPYTAFHGRYERESYAGVGPACYLAPPGTLPTRGELFCYRQPLLSAPALSSVAKPAHNARGYQYKPFRGASSAAPVAAGAAALLLSAGVSASEIPGLLERTAIKQTRQHDWSPFYGYGQIDADAAGVAAGVLAKRIRPKIEMPPSYGTTRGPKDYTDGYRQALKKLVVAVESGAPAAMWQLGNSLKERKYYPRHDMWAALVWWQRAAERGYPSAFCSLGEAYANAGLSKLTALPPIPYRPRLALALLEACENLGSGSKRSNFQIKRLKAMLSSSDVAAAKVLSSELQRKPSKYLPSLNYEYIPFP